MKLSYLLLGLILIPSVKASERGQQDGWQSYAIAETGAHVDIPSAIFSKDAGAVETGFGRRFLTADGRAKLMVQSIPNEAGQSPAAFMAKMNPPSGVVYQRVTSNLSCRASAIGSSGTPVQPLPPLRHCILINHPADEKRQWDGVVTRISNTLGSR